jgi:hypothetical protein
MTAVANDYAGYGQMPPGNHLEQALNIAFTILAALCFAYVLFV